MEDMFRLIASPIIVTVFALYELDSKKFKLEKISLYFLALSNANETHPSSIGATLNTFRAEKLQSNRN